MLKKTGNWGAQKQTVTKLDPDQVNDYFVGIATNSNYNRDSVIQAAQQPQAARLAKLTTPRIVSNVCWLGLVKPHRVTIKYHIGFSRLFQRAG